MVFWLATLADGLEGNFGLDENLAVNIHRMDAKIIWGATQTLSFAFIHVIIAIYLLFLFTRRAHFLARGGDLNTLRRDSNNREEKHYSLFLSDLVSASDGF
jgi:hypothetical protein